MNNNKMERMNGEVRYREKVMRGLKSDDTATLKGYQLYHNFIRPHEALDGKTPAETCGIIIEENDKWKTLIENAMAKRNLPNPKSVNQNSQNQPIIPKSINNPRTIAIINNPIVE